MLVRKFFAVVFIILVSLGTAWTDSASASSETAQAKFIDSLIGQAIKVLQVPVENKAEREAGFQKLLLHDFDMPTIVRLVLGRHWRAASPPQRTRFASAFQTHLISVYADSLGFYEGQAMTIEKTAPLTEKDTVVFTLILGEEEVPVRLDWRVRQTKEGLKVIDVATEGVSMVTTKRSEFTSLIAREGIEALIVRLENMNDKDHQNNENQ